MDGHSHRCNPDSCPFKRKAREPPVEEGLDEKPGFLPVGRTLPKTSNDNRIGNDIFQDCEGSTEGLLNNQMTASGPTGPSQFQKELSDLAKRSNALLARYDAERALICRQCQVEILHSSIFSPATTKVVLKAYVTSLPQQNPSKYSANIKPVTIEIPLDVEVVPPKNAVKDIQGRIGGGPGPGPGPGFGGPPGPGGGPGRSSSAGGYGPGGSYGSGGGGGGGRYGPGGGFGPAGSSRSGPIDARADDAFSNYGGGSFRDGKGSSLPARDPNCSCDDMLCRCLEGKSDYEGSTITIESKGIQTDFVSASFAQTERSGPSIAPLPLIDPEEEARKKRLAEEEEEARRRKEAEEEEARRRREEEEEARKKKEAEEEEARKRAAAAAAAAAALAAEEARKSKEEEDNEEARKKKEAEEEEEARKKKEEEEEEARKRAAAAAAAALAAEEARKKEEATEEEKPLEEEPKPPEEEPKVEEVSDELVGIPPDKRGKSFILALPQHKHLPDICTRCKFDPSPLVDEDGHVFCPGNCGCCLCPWIQRPAVKVNEDIKHEKLRVCKCRERGTVFTDFEVSSHCSNISYYDFCPCRTRAEAKHLELYGFEMNDEAEKIRRNNVDSYVKPAEIKKVYDVRPKSTQQQT